MTTPDQHNADRLKDLLFEAVERPPHERRAFLERATADAPALLARVLELLEAWERATTVLREHDTPATFAPSQRADLFQPGERIGPFILGPRIGEGGFGVVHRARQELPVKRDLAVKILRAGLNSRAVLSRFDGERQALARLTHPSIARIIDAGETPSGIPFFAMELVEGAPITVHCDSRQLGVRDRLDLFARVCHAVQHAHQKGIIHRDLKPSNILVADVDGEPIPKVIDFGIAKAVDEPLTDSTVLTLANQVVGTPRYMSPEQASFRPETVDTRSDIYSLGVVLYELLCGTTPLTDETLRAVALNDLGRVLREARVPRPSTRLSTVDSRDAAARARASQPARLERELSNDLDWIVMRAIDPDPDRRYQTALAFARDIERYLANEPVEARPPSRVYLARKFVRRHRATVFGGSAIAATMLVGLGASLYGLNRAAAERDAANEALVEARAVTDFLANTLASVDPAEKGRDIKVADLLDDAARELQNFDGSAATKGRLHHVIGAAFWALGDWKNAEREMRAAVLRREEALGSNARATLSSLTNLAAIIYEQGDLERALPHSKRVVDGFILIDGEESETGLGAMNNHALMLRAAGQLDQAHEMQRRVLDVTERVFGPNHGRTIGAMHNLGNTLHELGRADQAEQLLLEALERSEREIGPDAPETAMARMSVSNFYHREGRHAEARPLMEAVLQNRRRVHGDKHPSTLHALYNLGSNALAMEDPERALPYFAEIMRAIPESLPPGNPVALAAITNLAIALHEIGWQGLNEELSAALVGVCRLALASNPTLTHRNVIAHVLSSVEPPSLRDLDAAFQLAERAVLEAERADDEYLFGYLDTLAHVYAAYGRLDEAIEVQRRAIAIAPPDDPEFVDLQKHLDTYLTRAGVVSGGAEPGKTPGSPDTPGPDAAPLGN